MSLAWNFVLAILGIIGLVSFAGNFISLEFHIGSVIHEWRLITRGFWDLLADSALQKIDVPYATLLKDYCTLGVISCLMYTHLFSIQQKEVKELLPGKMTVAEFLKQKFDKSDAYIKSLNEVVDQIVEPSSNVFKYFSILTLSFFFWPIIMAYFIFRVVSPSSYHGDFQKRDGHEARLKIGSGLTNDALELRLLWRKTITLRRIYFRLYMVTVLVAFALIGLNVYLVNSGAPIHLVSP